MFEKIKRKIKNDELVKGSLILFVMLNVFNFLNYLFQFLMARLLGPADYSILGALMFFIYIFMIPGETIQTIIARYTSKFNARKDAGKIKSLLDKSMKKGIIISSIIFVLLLPLSFFFSYLLNINIWMIILTNIFVFYVFLVPITRGVLQGKKRFFDLGINVVLEGIGKVAISFILVIIGWKVYGAIIGMLIAGSLAFFMALIKIRKNLSKEKKSYAFDGIYSYSLPILIAITSITLMYSIDLILPRIFFTPENAGQYIVISMLGKIILFVNAAIGKTFFPLSSEKHERGKSSNKIFKKAIKITLLLSAIILLAYFFMPKMVIGILFGSEYTKASNILFIVGLAYTFFAFSNLFILYGLSRDRIKNSSCLLLGIAVIQIVLLSIFHSTLVEFSIAMLLSSLLMLITSISLNRK